MASATVLDTALLPDGFTEALRRCGSAKAIARAVDCSTRTAEDWLQGRREPRGRQVIRLMTAFDQFEAAILQINETNRGTHANHIAGGGYFGPDRRRSGAP